MQLVWFLTIGAIFSIVLGEFGQYPFGSTTFSISFTDFFIGVIMMLLLIWQVQTKTLPKKIPKFLWFYLVFWLICIISLVVSMRFSGITYLVRFLIYSSSVYLGYSLIQAKVTNYVRIFQVIFISGVLLSLVGFFQFYFYPDLEPLYMYGFDPHKNRLFSTFLDPNLLGTYLNISLISGLCLYWRNRTGFWTSQNDKLKLFLIGVIVAAIVLTFSRSAYVMLVVELLIFFSFYSRRILFGIVVLGLLIGLFVQPVQERIRGAFSVDQSASERIVSWQNGVYLVSRNPVLGVGFNNIRESQIENKLLRTNQKSDVNSGSGLDSSLLFVGATTGIIGLLSFISLFIYLAISLLQNWKSEIKLFAVCLIALSFAIMINSQFINSLFFTPILFVWSLLVGVWYSTITKN